MKKLLIVAIALLVATSTLTSQKMGYSTKNQQIIENAFKNDGKLKGLIGKLESATGKKNLSKKLSYAFALSPDDGAYIVLLCIPCLVDFLGITNAEAEMIESLMKNFNDKTTRAKINNHKKFQNESSQVVMNSIKEIIAEEPVRTETPQPVQSYGLFRSFCKIIGIAVGGALGMEGGPAGIAVGAAIGKEIGDAVGEMIEGDTNSNSYMARPDGSDCQGNLNFPFNN